MNNLNIKQKILVIVIITIVAILICYYAYTKEKGGNIETQIIEAKSEESSENKELRNRKNKRRFRKNE